MKKKIRCRNDLNLHTINKLREAKCVFFRFPGGGGGWLVGYGSFLFRDKGREEKYVLFAESVLGAIEMHLGKL